jgi:hypothetical protein
MGIGRFALIAFVMIGTGWTAFAEDPKERDYFTPALPPKHAEKPRVTGWAGQRIEEKLNRGLMAKPNDKGQVYLGWRLLKSDPEGVAFNVYRSDGAGAPVKLNSRPVSVTTDFIDERTSASRERAYFVRPVIEGKELAPSERVTLRATTRPPEGGTTNIPEGGTTNIPERGTTNSLAGENPFYFSIKFQGNYMPQKIAAADLNGDGAYDFVIKQPLQGIDPAGQPNRAGLTYKLEAYLSDGTFLWRKDLGAGIEPGIWYSPFVAYDFDGDGKAEVAVKTGPEDAREADGRVRQGPEWCSILDGLTGAERARADWPPRDPRLGDYNRTNRNQMGVAYLDGKTPCLLLARGTYKLMVVDAYQYHDRKLERLWRWEGDDETPIIRSQGAHNMHAADVDADGRDEIVLGSCVIDDNGTCLWSSGLGHPDKTYVTDVDPTRPGLEIFYAVEPHHDDGMGVCLLDARTGATIWKIDRPTKHVGDGMVADIDPSRPGLECWAAEDPKGGSRDRYMFGADGKPFGEQADVPDCRNWAFWDADLLREIVAGGGGRGGFRGASIAKYKGPTLAPALDGAVAMIADLLGDWREEIVTVRPGELCIYTTTIPATDRRVCLMQDPIYRADVAHRSMGYDQSPAPSYYLGVGAAKVGNK